MEPPWQGLTPHFNADKKRQIIDSNVLASVDGTRQLAGLQAGGLGWGVKEAREGKPFHWLILTFSPHPGAFLFILLPWFPQIRQM